MKHLYLLGLIGFFFLLACEPKKMENTTDLNPAAEGFNVENSSEKAITIADSVMLAMGGRKAWDAVKYLRWNFFGSRRHTWNKHNGDLIVEGLRDSSLVRMNLESMEGQVVRNNQEITNVDSLAKYLQLAKEMWINDSYWVFMPFKLKDSGVSLNHVKTDSIYEVLSLQFENVGVTPENKYHVYVDTTDYLIKRWDFFSSEDDSSPRFNTPWTNYNQFNGVLLSSDRGEKYKITEISAHDSLASYFDSTLQ